MVDRTLLLVGCGRMGSALMQRWHDDPPAGITQHWVIEPHHTPVMGLEDTWISNLEFLPTSVRPHIIVFATKPQQLTSILHLYRTRFGKQPLYISIAAGKTLAYYETHLGKDARVVRAMPNTPALIGKGITALCARNTLSGLSKNIATELMQMVGNVVWVENDNLMDAVTAISGSGPAYVFLFLEALTQAGVKAGLSEDMAKQLAIDTLIGSGELARSSKRSFETLRERVTSPGGTTEAALNVLMRNDQFAELIEKAVMKAVDRAKVIV